MTRRPPRSPLFPYTTLRESLHILGAASRLYGEGPDGDGRNEREGIVDRAAPGGVGHLPQTQFSGHACQGGAADYGWRDLGRSESDPTHGGPGGSAGGRASQPAVDGARAASTARHLRGSYQQGNWGTTRRHGWRGQGDAAAVVSKDGGPHAQPVGTHRAGRFARAATVSAQKKWFQVT